MTSATSATTVATVATVPSVPSVPATVVTGLVDDPAAVVALSSRVPARPGRGNVSLVVGGGDPVGERTRLLRAVGLDLRDGVAMRQAHGGAVAVVGADDAGRGMTDQGNAVADVDALITFDTDVALMVMTADCVPVLMVDPARGVAAAHAGRRGLTSGVVTSALRTLTSHPGRVSAIIGPAIGGCCYEVPDRLAAEVTDVHPAARATTTWGSAALDLPTAVEAELHAGGVGHVARLGGCTRCEDERWFSHRREPGLGRQAAIIARRSRSLGRPPLEPRRSDPPDGAVEVTPSPATAFLHWPS